MKFVHVSSMMLWLYAGGAPLLVPLTGPEGQRQWISIGQITSLRAPVKNDLTKFAKNVHCVITTTSGKFMAVRETCEDVEQMIRSTSR